MAVAYLPVGRWSGPQLLAPPGPARANRLARPGPRQRPVGSAPRNGVTARRASVPASRRRVPRGSARR
jgi:hypothetical protein